MAFGDRTGDIQTGYVPRVEGGNVGVTQPNYDVGLSTLMSGIGRHAAAQAKAKSNKALGSDIADAIDTLTIAQATRTPVEVAQMRSSIAAELGRRHGADAIKDWNTVSEKVGKADGKISVLDAEQGLFAITDDNGNVRSRFNIKGETFDDEQPLTAGQIIQEDVTKKAAYLAETAPEYSQTVNTIMGIVGPALEAHPTGTAYVQRAVDAAYGSIRNIESWAKRTAQVTHTVGSVDAIKEFKAEARKSITGSALNAIQSLANPSFLDALRGTGVDPETMGRVVQSYTNDLINNMDEMQMFSTLGIDAATFRNEIAGMGEGVSKLFTAAYEGDLTAIKRVQAELAATTDAIENGLLLDMDPETRNEFLLAKKNVDRMNTRVAMRDLNARETTNYQNPLEMWEYVHSLRTDPNPASMLKTWDQLSGMRSHFASGEGLVAFLGAFDTMLETSPAIWSYMSPYIDENKELLVKKAQEFGLDLTTFFDNKPALDAAFEKAVTDNGMTMEEFRASLRKTDEVERAISYITRRRGF